MGGESLQNTTIIEGGILGDRGYALIDQTTGKIACAKMPKFWVGLLELEVVLNEAPRIDQKLPPVLITWPDGVKAITDGENPAKNSLKQLEGQ